MASNFSDFIGGGSAGLTFAGYTTIQYTGSIAGLIGANVKCDSKYAGSHFCNVNEFLSSGVKTAPTGNGAWIFSSSSDAQGTGNSVHYRHGCLGWNTLSSGMAGGYIATSGGYSIDSCNNAKFLACCN